MSSSPQKPADPMYLKQSLSVQPTSALELSLISDKQINAYFRIRVQLTAEPNVSVRRQRLFGLAECADC